MSEVVVMQRGNWRMVVDVFTDRGADSTEPLYCVQVQQGSDWQTMRMFYSSARAQRYLERKCTATS